MGGNLLFECSALEHILERYVKKKIKIKSFQDFMKRGDAA
jgi:hypothetical protein